MHDDRVAWPWHDLARSRFNYFDDERRRAFEGDATSPPRAHFVAKRILCCTIVEDPAAAACCMAIARSSDSG